MIKINGVLVSCPKTFKVDISDIDGESNRNAAGELIRDRIAIKRKIALEWGPLTQNDISSILDAVKNVFFTVEFPDPQLGVTTKTMYVGDRSMAVYILLNGVPHWEGLSFNLIEK